MRLVKSKSSPLTSRLLNGQPCPDVIGVSALSFSDVYLEASQLSHLISAELSSVETLDLSDTYLGDEGVDVLAQAKTLSSLRSLDLSIPGFEYTKTRSSTDDRVPLELTREQMQARALTCRAMESLAQWPQLKALRALSLNGNLIGDRGLEALLSSAFMPALTSLQLHHNGITHAGVEVLVNTSQLSMLEFLSVDGDIGALGVEALLHSSTLKSLAQLVLIDAPESLSLDRAAFQARGVNVYVMSMRHALLRPEDHW